MDYKLHSLCGITTWVAKKDILPLEFEQLYLNPFCISILPLDSNVIANQVLNIQIKELYNKMLQVLEFPIQHLVKAVVHYAESTSVIQHQKHITEKILAYAPHLIILFGNLDLLSEQLIDTNKIFVKKILHPIHLLNYPKDKVLAYQDLLECKQRWHV